MAFSLATKPTEYSENRMSESSDYYMSWLGCGSFGAVGKVVSAGEPVVFQPTDLSGCDIWFDATDNLTITVDSKDNTSVLSWFNKGDLSGNMEPTVGTGQYNIDTINTLPVVQFGAGNQMGWTGALATQEKTCFVISKQLIDLTTLGVPFLRLWSGDQSDAFQFGIAYSGGLFYYQQCRSGVYCVSATDTDNYYDTPQMTTWRIATNDANNLIRVNAAALSIYENYPASGFNTSTMQYTVNRTDGSAQDIGEIIIYNRALSDEEVAQVEAYLITRWGTS